MPEEEPSNNGGGELVKDEKVAGLLCYVAWWITGLIFYLSSKNSYVRFHAMQSILISIVLIIVYFVIFILSFAVPFIFMISWLVYLAAIVLWILMMVKAYQGDKFKLPIIGEMAERYANK